MAPNYQDAADTVARALELAGKRTLLSTLSALELIDANGDFDFDGARDSDPAWPTTAKSAAGLALRALRDSLDDAHATEEEKGSARTTAILALRTLRNALEQLATPPNVLDTLSTSDVHDLLRYALCMYQWVAPCSPPTAERTAAIMRRGRAFLTAAPDVAGPYPTTSTTILLNADTAVNYAVDKVAGPAPADRVLRPAWEVWRAAVHEHLLNGCPGVGIDDPTPCEPL